MQYYSQKATVFDSDRYLRLQSRAIQEKLKARGADRVYIEFGGKIFDDMHAARVLPGYYPDMKLRIIKKLFGKSDLILAVSAKDIIRKRVRGDHKITYDAEVLRLLAAFGKQGVLVKRIAITRMPDNGSRFQAVDGLVKKLRQKGKEVIFLKESQNHIDPKKDWREYHGSDFFSTNKKYVIVISPGGGSGKFGVCINQLFHEMETGITPFYIKFETFPVHDLSVIHPLNLAYMAASADFYDLVMKDPRKRSASSYNRDIENYELLHSLSRYFSERGNLLRKITSATNMGINMISKAVGNWEEVEKESMAEIGRRFIRHVYEVRKGQENHRVIRRMKKIISLALQYEGKK